METLLTQSLHVIYQVKKITGDPETKKHLQQLGIQPSNKLALIKRDKEIAILSLRNNRIALSSSLLEHILVEEVTTHQHWLPLDQLTIGEIGKVISIYGHGAIRRRLMDMGVTKNIPIVIKKVAPLGDPIEVTLRNYELTLRKEEAALILVSKEEK